MVRPFYHIFTKTLLFPHVRAQGLRRLDTRPHICGLEYDAGNQDSQTKTHYTGNLSRAKHVPSVITKRITCEQLRRPWKDAKTEEPYTRRYGLLDVLSFAEYHEVSLELSTYYGAHFLEYKTLKRFSRTAEEIKTYFATSFDTATSIGK